MHLHTILRTPSHCSALASSKADSVCHRTHHARETTRTLLESSTLARHAGSLKRPRGTCAFCSTLCATTRQQCSNSVYSNLCCVLPVLNSKFSIRSLGRRSSSSPWQPNWPSCAGDSGNGQKQPTAAGALAELANAEQPLESGKAVYSGYTNNRV